MADNNLFKKLKLIFFLNIIDTAATINPAFIVSSLILFLVLLSYFITKLANTLAFPVSNEIVTKVIRLFPTQISQTKTADNITFSSGVAQTHFLKMTICGLISLDSIRRGIMHMEKLIFHGVICINTKSPRKKD